MLTIDGFEVRKNAKTISNVKKNATTAFVVAIVGLILSFLFALDGLVLSMIGLVLAARAKVQQRSKANAALVISIIGLVFAVLHMVVGAVAS